MIRAALVALLLLGATAGRARADVWKDATAGQAGADADEFYKRALDRGDDAAAQAMQRGMRAQARIATIDKAIAAYEVAAKAKPGAGEPYARIAKVINSFYFELCAKNLTPQQLMQLPFEPSPFCDVFSPPRARQLIAAWDALEARAPLDPRITTCPAQKDGPCIYFERAILNTKLATPEGLAAAARDYQRIIDHPAPDHDLGTVANNLAETDMMLGNLDGAIQMYRFALQYRSDDSAAFGLAVALDRDGQAFEALALVREIGLDGYERFLSSIARGETFFVPPGEEHYYYAIAQEAFSDPTGALSQWQQFIASGAHPQYQPRARAHVTALTEQLKLHPPVVRPRPIDFDE